MSGETAVESSPAHDHEAVWNALMNAVATRLRSSTAGPQAALFTTDAEGLWEAFVHALPEPDRQGHQCRACRHFVTRHGGLGVIGPDGELRSALWAAADVPALYGLAMREMERLVRRASVTGVFLTRDPVLGRPAAGGWTHLHGYLEGRPATIINHSPVMSDEQAMAAKRQDHETVGRALSAYSAEALAQAKRVLESDTLSRSDRYLAPLQWLIDARAERIESYGKRADNLLWRRIATAPAGFCHPRSSVLAPLLDSIEQGLPFEVLAELWARNLDPRRFQRAQVAPDRGNIEEAEKIVAKMGLAPSLARRHARLDEVLAAAGPAVVWTPPAAPPPPTVPPGESVFGHLEARDRSAGVPGGTPAVELPTRTLTWDKFRREMLPHARAMDVLVGPGAAPYMGLVTAEDPEAPPILKWDRPGHRNPFSWYVYAGGSHPQVWGLLGGWTAVEAVVPMPPAWGPEPLAPHSYEGVVLLLQGAADRGMNNSALFPEFMVAELFPVRATIEAYSKSRPLAGAHEASAAGWAFRKGSVTAGEFPVIRVRDAQGHKAIFRIDRWD